MLLGLPFVVFLPLYDTYTYIKAISQESKPRNSSDYKKSREKNLPPTPNFATKLVDFTKQSRFH